MKRLWLLAVVCLLGTVPACRSTPVATSSPTAQITPTAPPSPSTQATIVAGVLVPPPSPVILPGDVTLSAPTGDVVWALLNSAYLYRSRDQGSTWEQRPLPPAASAPNFPEISFVDDTVGWLLVPGVPETQCNGAGAALWRTTDAGTTWQEVAYVDQGHQSATGIGYPQCKQSLSFVDSTHGFLGASDPNHKPTIYRTADGGSTWFSSMLPDPPGFTTLAGGFTLQAGLVRSFARELLVSASGNSGSSSVEFVFRSLDGGATWTYAATAPAAELSVTFVTSSRWLELIYPGQSIETTDSGVSWHASASDYGQAAPIAPEIQFGDALVGYATVRGQIQRTVDGGLHWTSIKTPGTDDPGTIQGT